MMIPSLLQPFFRSRMALALVLLASTAALAAALIAQFAFALKPCVLCLYQRIPYLLALAAAALLLPLAGRAPRAAQGGLAALVVLFLAGAGLAFFHVGVEAGWWVFGSGCPVVSLEGKSEQEALALLLTTPQADCREVAWRFLGLSITAWNLLMSLGLAAYLALTLYAERKRG